MTVLHQFVDKIKEKREPEHRIVCFFNKLPNFFNKLADSFNNIFCGIEENGDSRKILRFISRYKRIGFNSLSQWHRPPSPKDVTMFTSFSTEVQVKTHDIPSVALPSYRPYRPSLRQPVILPRRKTLALRPRISPSVPLSVEGLHSPQYRVSSTRASQAIVFFFDFSYF